MGRKVELTWKQQEQIIKFFEESHTLFCDPENISNSAIIALFRVCKNYIVNMAGPYLSGYGATLSDEQKQIYRNELLEKLDMLSIRYYKRI